MALKKLPPEQIVAIAAAVVVTAGALLHFQGLRRQHAALATLEADIQSASQANVAAEQAIRSLPALRQAVHQFAAQVPPNADLSPLLSSIGTDLVAADGAPEREITTKPTIAGTPVARTPFSLQYRGSFRGTVSLLNHLDQGALLTRVERIVVEKDAATDNAKPLRVQLAFSTFSRTAKELEAWAHAKP